MMITADDAIKALREVVAERGPEYVYVAPNVRDEPDEVDADGYPIDAFPTYVEEDGTPGCAVGAVMAKLDPSNFARLAGFEGHTPRTLVKDGVLDATHNAVEILDIFQVSQDVGDSYAHALKGAEVVYADAI